MWYHDLPETITINMNHKKVLIFSLRAGCFWVSCCFQTSVCLSSVSSDSYNCWWNGKLKKRNVVSKFPQKSIWGRARGVGVRQLPLPSPLQSRVPTHPPASHRHQPEENWEESPGPGANWAFKPSFLKRFSVVANGQETPPVTAAEVLDFRRSVWGSTPRSCSFWRRPWRFSPRWARSGETAACVAGCGPLVPRARTRPERACPRWGNRATTTHCGAIKHI